MRALPAALGLLVLVAAVALPCRARAGGEVLGSADAIQIHVENVSTRQVLDMLAAKFQLRYKLSASVGRELSGAYSGSLEEVLARILDGTDYILRTQGDSFEVIVLGPSAPTAGSGIAVSQIEIVAPRLAGPPPSAAVAPAQSPPIEAVGGPFAPPPILPAASAPPPLQTYLLATTP